MSATRLGHLFAADATAPQRDARRTAEPAQPGRAGGSYGRRRGPDGGNPRSPLQPRVAATWCARP